MLLNEYEPVAREVRSATLQRKREEYADLVGHYFGGASKGDTVDLLNKRLEGMSTFEAKNYKQIRIDVHRTQPEVKLFASQPVQTLLIRVLFVWSMRHPASAYVQGINDLAAPLLLTFLAGEVHRARHEAGSVQVLVQHLQELKEEDLQVLSEAEFSAVEADVFWCLSRLLDEVQDNYTDMQPGVHKMLNKMRAVVEQVDDSALRRLEEIDIQFMDFAYRWVSCYLTREFSVTQIARLWDAYFAEEQGFSEFHCYVCAGLFLHFVPQVIEMPY